MCLQLLSDEKFYKKEPEEESEPRGAGFGFDSPFRRIGIGGSRNGTIGSGNVTNRPSIYITGWTICIDGGFTVNKFFSP
ncbi:hypothetical protein ACOSQ2_025221 [Xanthoceras sorbifolium]